MTLTQESEKTGKDPTGFPSATSSLPRCHASLRWASKWRTTRSSNSSFQETVPGAFPAIIVQTLYILMCQVYAEGSEQPLMPVTPNQTVPHPHLPT